MIVSSIDWAAALDVAGFSFSMVFLLLIFIVLVLTLSGRFFANMDLSSKRREARKALAAIEPEVEMAESVSDACPIDGEVTAAISMAIKACKGIKHDVESNIITIEKGVKNYSPWSSKIYGIHVFTRN